MLLLFANCATGGLQDPLIQGYITRYQDTAKLETLCIANGAAIPADVRQYMSGQAGSAGTCPMMQDMAGQAEGSANTLPMMDVDGSVSQAFGANPDKLTLVLVDLEGHICLRQEAPSSVETNTELAKQIEIVTGQH